MIKIADKRNNNYIQVLFKNINNSLDLIASKNISLTYKNAHNRNNVFTGIRNTLMLEMFIFVLETSIFV